MCMGLVIIKAQPSVPVLDAGSALFLDGGEPLGEVYETFGPVSTPLYVVVLPNSACLLHTAKAPSKVKPNRRQCRRAFSSDVTEIIIIDPDSEGPDQATEFPADAASPANEHLLPSHEKIPDVQHSPSHSPPKNDTELSASLPLIEPLRSDVENQPAPTLIPNVNVGDTVHFVRNNPDLSIPVFYSQLLQMKGSDASWIGDVEPPPDELEFSDDEKERIYKRSLKAKRHSSFSDSPPVGDVPCSSFTRARAKGNRPAQRGRPYHGRINGMSSGTESSWQGVNAPQDPNRLQISSHTNFTQPPVFSLPVPSPCYNSPSFRYNQPLSNSNHSDSGQYVSESAPPCFPAPGFSNEGRWQFEGSNFVQDLYANGHGMANERFRITLQNKSQPNRERPDIRPSNPGNCPC
ncbi:uncharacterized protein DEA37_0014830 [Paragonimus westermani]|uniref:H/ACA ribonucleoprotein complex non-core subunit NAF1 n=1 Tax=Paragonimus westermani TaxID=34504 RepID=A0A5J4N7G3_9TREM|nr:uncharacterized protein DEA37_0014830 [Paragonimus westermani]